MAGKPGLRERKKQQTRLTISQVATRMFIERGFDAVTVAEVAEAAEVSVNTIFNYFSNKEELFFDRAAEMEGVLGEVVRSRRVGESVVEVLHRRFREVIRDDTASLLSQRMAPFVRTVDASPALKSRLRILLEQSEVRLAQTLMEEGGAKADDSTARAVAALVVALESMLIEEYRTLLLLGDSEEEIRSALLKLGDRGFRLLKSGAQEYCRRPSRSRTATDRR